MKIFVKMIPYLIINALAFYLLPLLMFYTSIGMIVLLVAFPLICFITSLIYGSQNGLNILYAVIISVIFIPTLFIFYNYTAWIYVIGYGVISLIGNFVGNLLRNRYV